MKRIEIKLLSDEPRGPKMISFSGDRPVAVISVSREDMRKVASIPELQQYNFYILLNTKAQQIYVGQTKDFINRSRTHRRSEKLEWNQALVLTKSQDKTKMQFEASHVQHFEYLAYTRLKDKTKLFRLVNNQPVKSTYIDPHTKANLNEDFEHFIALLSVINIFPFDDRSSDATSISAAKDKQSPSPSTKKGAGAMTYLDAAYLVLSESGKPLHIKEITNIALRRGLIVTAGKTPAATMSARVTQDILRNSSSRFIKVDPGVYRLK